MTACGEKGCYINCSIWVLSVESGYGYFLSFRTEKLPVSYRNTLVPYLRLTSAYLRGQ